MNNNNNLPPNLPKETRDFLNGSENKYEHVNIMRDIVEGRDISYLDFYLAGEMPLLDIKFESPQHSLEFFCKLFHYNPLYDDMYDDLHSSNSVPDLSKLSYYDNYYGMPGDAFRKLSDFVVWISDLNPGLFALCDYALLILMITITIFLGITKIGSLYKSKIYLVAIIGIMGYILIKDIESDSYTEDNHFLTIIAKFLGLLFLGYFMLLQQEEKQQTLRFEYPTILLLALFGILLTLENTESLVIFLGLEIQAFSYYTMISLNEKDISSAEGALKYFLIGAMASGLFILGVGLLYGNFGKTNFAEMVDLMTSKENLVWLGGLLIIISLLFKIGAAPFHFWLPDAYAGAPFYVLLFLITLPKIALFYLLFTLNNLFEQNLLILLALLMSALVGSIQAYDQTKIKKFIAYTVIYNNAFFLGVMFLAGKGAFYGLMESLILYILVTITTALCFFALTHAETNVYLWNLRDLLAIKKSNSMLALVLIVGFFSAAGIPPFIGFFQKYLVLWLLAEKLQVFLLVVLILSSILPAFYYIRIPKITYFVAESRYIIFKNMTKILSTLLAACGAISLLIFY